MVTIMAYAGAVAADAAGTRTGGVPLVPAGFAWPRCGECEGPMQFLAQIDLADLEPERTGRLSIFMCQNDPGLCGDWDATGGANRAFLSGTAGSTPAVIPENGVTTLDEVSGIALVPIAAEGYFDAREQWPESTGRPIREVLGQIGGQPAWLQGDEIPECRECEKPMSFVAQFEEGHDHRTSANFGGGGCAYAFCCEPCGEAAFLWQC